MSEPTKEQILAALADITEPNSGDPVSDRNVVRGLLIKDGHVGFTLEFAPNVAPQMEPLRQACQERISTLPGVSKVTVVLTAHSEGGATQAAPATPQDTQQRPHMRTDDGQSVAPRKAPQTASGIPGVQSIIAVASGKGGVGKSTTAVNLALGLAKLGRRVGILDADIYGPSIPRLMGIKGKPHTLNDRIVPMENHGIICMSIGFLVDEDTPMIWRGPMVISALTQLMNEVAWDTNGPLDVLVVDMPPGTGDAQLTMAQRVPLTGSVIVSTPQDIALIDARKGLAMFQRTEVPVFGIVENMSVFVCPNCGEASNIFGHGGARETARELGVDFLGEIPLHMSIRELSDAGRPVVVADPDSPQAQAYLRLAETVGEKIDSAMSGAAKSGPNIVFE